MDFKKNPRADFEDVGNLGKEEARRQIEALQEGIDYHDYLYYTKNAPEISDALYDKLFHRLLELEEAFPDLQSDSSPTQRVGAAPVDKLKKIEHTAPMLSLNAALEKKKVQDFCDFVRRRVDAKEVVYVLEPKYDGLSVELVYENRSFKWGATRGDGRVGEEITKNLMTIGAVPLRIQSGENTPASLAVRGEVFMPKDGFQRLNKERIEKGESPFANPRNAAAGIMRQLDPKNVANKPLDILFYEILSIEQDNISSHWEVLKRFPEWGFKTDPRVRKCASFEEIEKFHHRLSEKRDDFEYDIDGVVIKLDDYRLREKLGTRQRSPRWAFAWKFPPKEEVTTMESIAVQVGRTGKLTPVALLQPVDVGGVTISRATLHNEDEVYKKDVRAGDTVRVARAGDVIPEVVERIKTPGKKRKKPFSMPDRCPACGSEIIREGAYHFCPARLSCPPQIVGAIVHYGSRDALNIDGLGDKTAEDMVKKGLVENISDLYTLSVEDLLTLDGFAEKSAEQLYDAVRNTKAPRLDRFLYALGIRHVGQRVAGILADAYGSLDALKTASKKDLERIPEIGSEIAHSVAEFFSRKETEEVLAALSRAGVKVQKSIPEKGPRPLEGKTFVFTGSLDAYTRKEAQEQVERLGGRTASSVSSSTDYVVVGKDPGGKYETAKDRNVDIIHEDRFKELLSSPS